MFCCACGYIQIYEHTFSCIQSGMSEIVGRTGDKAKVSSVLLLTDGLANVGVSNREGIMDEMRKVIDPPGGKTVSSCFLQVPSIYNYWFYSLLRALFILSDLVLIMMLVCLSHYPLKEGECTITLTLKRRYLKF